MLQVTLAGLVISKIITLEEAEKIFKRLSFNKIPHSVKGVIDEIDQIRKEG